jgi:hypothetical protein
MLLAEQKPKIIKSLRLWCLCGVSKNWIKIHLRLIYLQRIKTNVT